MSITAVSITKIQEIAPMAARNGKGEASWLAKWCTLTYAPSPPSSSAATARSIDCSSASDAELVCDCADGFQCPNERNPMLFMTWSTPVGTPLFLVTGLRRPSPRRVRLDRDRPSYDCAEETSSMGDSWPRMK